MTGSEEGRNLIGQCEDIVASLAKLTEDQAETIAKDSLLSLVNLSTDEHGASILLKVVSTTNETNVEFTSQKLINVTLF